MSAGPLYSEVSAFRGAPGEISAVVVTTDLSAQTAIDGLSAKRGVRAL
ncbi:hypothetical protein [Kineosporia sp. NBRC 101677]|nr:hypothetical protein [Kineosporia sp. NBRC 101677]